MNELVIKCACGANRQSQVDECAYVNCPTLQTQVLERLKAKLEADPKLINVLKRLADR